jgi:hypothetical protein
MTEEFRYNVQIVDGVKGVVVVAPRDSLIKPFRAMGKCPHAHCNEHYVCSNNSINNAKSTVVASLRRHWKKTHIS